MSSYVTLLGAEQVQSAASQMTRAADEMQRAASSISYALEQHQRFLDEWLNRLSGLMEDRISDYRNAQS